MASFFGMAETFRPDLPISGWDEKFSATVQIRSLAKSSERGWRASITTTMTENNATPKKQNVYAQLIEIQCYVLCLAQTKFPKSLIPVPKVYAHLAIYQDCVMTPRRSRDSAILSHEK